MNAIKRTFQYAGLGALKVGSRVFAKSSLQTAVQSSLACKMAGMKGVPMKICQVLGMSDGKLAEINRQALQQVLPMSKDEMLTLLKERCPVLFYEGVMNDDQYGASLGQVARIEYNQGFYAVKMQYPDSDSNVKIDSSSLSLVTDVFSSFSKGFQLEEYCDAFKKELANELDYTCEAECQNDFYRIFADNPNIIIPLPLNKFSTGNCLVMSWEESMPIDDFLRNADEHQKKEVSRHFVDFYLKSIFEHGLVHADPNPGNFGIRLEDGKAKLVVYDFGSTVRLDKQTHAGLLAIFKLLMERKNPLAGLIGVGFEESLLAPLKQQIPALMMVLLEPFLAEFSYELSSWNRSLRVKDVLGDNRWNFMIAAPAEMIFLMRAFYGLFHYTGKLSGKIYCRPYLEKILFKQDKFICANLDLSHETGLSENEELSMNMIISIKECGSQKVKLTLPVLAVDNLRDFMPADVGAKLDSRGIDVDTLVKNVRRNGYRPQEVFSLIDGNREIMVYLK